MRRTLTVIPQPPADSDLAPLRIIARGSTWVVADKPAGLLSVPGKGDDPRKRDCVAARVAAMFPDAAGPLIVHRLDMDTSGLIVLGLTPQAQRALSKQFEERSVTKRYTALLDGIVEHAREGEVRLPIRLDPANRPWQIVDAIHGRDSITQWRVTAHEIDRTRVEFAPVTGRAHQLRVHAATSIACGGIGHCILGDVLYGSNYRRPGELGRLAPADRMMLHASYLAFNDPTSGQRIETTSLAAF
ncbi:MAG: RluA family pseudouridine synthase [Phycisphaerae bacterium]|nr:RluA family pseudouridine synthase [Phycisphaerae bacterium]